jgi:hypothetical protein
MLSQTASDAVIVSLRRPLNWANTVTWPVRLTVRLVRIEELTQTHSPHTPPSVRGQGVFRQVGAANRIGLRSRERKPDSCCGHPALTSDKPTAPGLDAAYRDSAAPSFSVTRCRTSPDSCPNAAPASCRSRGRYWRARRLQATRSAIMGTQMERHAPPLSPSPASDRESHSESQRGTASGDSQPHRAAT